MYTLGHFKSLIYFECLALPQQALLVSFPDLLHILTYCTIPSVHGLNRMLQTSSLNFWGHKRFTWTACRTRGVAFMCHIFKSEYIMSKVVKSCSQVSAQCQFLELSKANNPHLLSAAISQVPTGVKTHWASNSLQILFSTSLTFLLLPACTCACILESFASFLAAEEVLCFQKCHRNRDPGSEQKHRWKDTFSMF